MSDSRGYRTPSGAVWTGGRLVCCDIVELDFGLIVPYAAGYQFFTFVIPVRSTVLSGIHFKSSELHVIRRSDGLVIQRDSLSVNADITSGEYGRETVVNGPATIVEMDGPPDFYPNACGSYSYQRTGKNTPYNLVSFTPGSSLSVVFYTTQPRPEYDVRIRWTDAILPAQAWSDAVYAFARVVTDAAGNIDYAASIQSAGGIFFSGGCAGLGNVTETSARIRFPSEVNISGGTIYRAGNHRLRGLDSVLTQTTPIVSTPGCSNLSVPCTGAIAGYPNLPQIFSDGLTMFPWDGLKDWQSTRDLELDQSCAP
jgi:hypothetical protein